MPKVTPGKKASSRREEEVVRERSLKEFLGGKWEENIEHRDIDYYFNSYGHIGIHEEMLQDRVRTVAYRDAILNNSHVFKDKIVLDIGAGTGILSMFAAKAGAKHVYGIEYSDVAEMARRIIKENKLDDRITIIQGKAEEVELPVPEVDIIVSEWMGYFLLYESMLDSVLHCRDRWLRKEGGIILPNRAQLHVAGLEDGSYRREKFEFWDYVYGFDFTPMKQCVLEEPLVDYVDANSIVTESVMIMDIDLKTCTAKDLDFVKQFELSVTKQDFCHALVAWFDCVFDDGLHKPVVLSTAPDSQNTHWKQTVFYAPSGMPVRCKETIKGVIAVRKGSPNPRTIDVKIQYDFDGQIASLHQTQIYRIR